MIVHDVDEEALARLRTSLAKAGGSVEAEVRSMIKERAGPSEADSHRRAEEVVAALRERRRRLHEQYGMTINLTEALLQERAEG